MSNNKAIFLGAGDGGDIDEFFKHYGRDWDVYAVEAHPVRAERLRKKFAMNVTVDIMEVAASVEDGTMPLYLGPNLNNSSLDGSKVNCNKGMVDVKSIDFPTWMKSKFSPDNKILLLMDIEGGEFPLLEKMKQEWLFDWIDEFYIEFHGRKLKDFDIQIEIDWINFLKEKFGKKVYICKVYQHNKFKVLNSEER